VSDAPSTAPLSLSLSLVIHAGAALPLGYSVVREANLVEFCGHGAGGWRSAEKQSEEREGASALHARKLA
jgi:hypothetical protein